MMWTCFCQIPPVLCWIWCVVTKKNVCDFVKMWRPPPHLRPFPVLWSFAATRIPVFEPTLRVASTRERHLHGWIPPRTKQGMLTNQPHFFCFACQFSLLTAMRCHLDMVEHAKFTFCFFLFFFHAGRIKRLLALLRGYCNWTPKQMCYIVSQFAYHGLGRLSVSAHCTMTYNNVPHTRAQLLPLPLSRVMLVPVNVSPPLVVDSPQP